MRSFEVEGSVTVLRPETLGFFVTVQADSFGAAEKLASESALRGEWVDSENDDVEGATFSGVEIISIERVDSAPVENTDDEDSDSVSTSAPQVDSDTLGFARASVEPRENGYVPMWSYVAPFESI